jgi:putative ABC transport system ATP-binding protein
MQTVIETRNISKDFSSGDETMRVLHGISITLYAGELTMLVGPSGCGKTTLLSIISGILRSTEGEVWIGGRDVTHMKDRHKVLLRREEIGFIFQQYNLLPALTAAENAAVPLVAAGMPLGTASKKAKGLLAQVGMGDHAHKLPRQLSGGQQQRVAIVRALIHEPRLIVCDEPTAALDAATGNSVMELLRNIASKPDSAVLVVTHDNRIYHFADRILHMSDGRIERDERKGVAA